MSNETIKSRIELLDQSDAEMAGRIQDLEAETRELKAKRTEVKLERAELQAHYRDSEMLTIAQTSAKVVAQMQQEAESIRKQAAEVLDSLNHAVVNLRDVMKEVAAIGVDRKVGLEADTLPTGQSVGLAEEGEVTDGD